MSSHHDRAAQLRTTRRYFGLAIADLETLLGADHRLINRWESGSVPIPGPVMDALQQLRELMATRLEQREAHLEVGATVTMYRDEAELAQAEPFYRHLPPALHEWEIAQLQASHDVRVTYSERWISGHPNRSPYSHPPAALQPGIPGRQSFLRTANVPADLRELLDGHLAPGLALDVPTAIAFAHDLPVERVLDIEAAGVPVREDWEAGPGWPALASLAVTVDAYLIVDNPGDLHPRYALLVAAHRDIAGVRHVYGQLPSDRMPWIPTTAAAV